MKGIICSFIIAGMFLLSALGVQAQTTAEDIRKRAKEAFGELDRQVVELEKRQQAEFKLLVEAEVALFGLQAQDSALSDSIKTRALGMVWRYANKVLADTVASAQAKTAQFNEFMRQVRVKFGLVEKAVADTIITAGRDTTKLADAVSGPARPAPISNIFKARKEANWEENMADKNLPREWWMRTSTWTSKDGKVTFAVGRGQSRDLNIARDKAALDARVRLVRRDTVAPVVSWELAGSQVIRYKQQTEEDWGGWQAFCLVAVPTALLP